MLRLPWQLMIVNSNSSWRLWRFLSVAIHIPRLFYILCMICQASSYSICFHRLGFASPNPLSASNSQQYWPDKWFVYYSSWENCWLCFFHSIASLFMVEWVCLIFTSCSDVLGLMLLTKILLNYLSWFPCRIQQLDNGHPCSTPTVIQKNSPTLPFSTTAHYWMDILLLVLLKMHDLHILKRICTVITLLMFSQRKYTCKLPAN